MVKKMKLAVVKLGCIGSLPFIDLILDERAEREDIEVVSFGTGSKLTPNLCQDAAEQAKKTKADLFLIATPNASLPGPAAVRSILTEAGYPSITVTDAPGKRAFLRKDGEILADLPDDEGFIMIPMDPMIGARRDFLDATEMVIFNGHIVNVLASAGVIRATHHLIDGALESIRKGEVELPRMILKKGYAVEHASFANPYAAAKAHAALHILEAVAPITTYACFRERERNKYLMMVAAAHEMVRAASHLIDEAREIEKGNDSVLRTPHRKENGVRTKKNLLAKSE